MRTERCNKILKGIVAFSSFNHYSTPNAIDRRPDPVKSPTTLADVHVVVVPPHWSASNRQQIAPIMRTAPCTSKFPNFSDSSNFRSTLLALRSLRMRKIRTKAVTRIGKLLLICLVSSRYNMKENTYIQKHHLQLTCSVKVLPIKGPKQAATPKTLRTIPIYRGRFSSGQVYPTILIAP